MQPQKKQKGKKIASKENDVVQLDASADVSPTSVGKSKLNTLNKDFPYKEFVDWELMTLATLEAFHGDEDDLVEKLQ